MSATFDQAKDFFLQGLAHYQAGRYEQADAQLAASLALLPGRPSTLTNLGATRLKLGRAGEALELLDEALAQEPGNVEALGHRATALAELGKLHPALAGVEQVLALAPGLGQAWSLRGSLLKDLGRTEEAAASFEKAIAHGADAELNGYYLASLRGGQAPSAPPRHYVENLFDGYAGDFEEHLVRVLNYRAHDVLAGGVRKLQRRFASALDLGCGTGLCGPLVRPLAQRLEGVDLSANMVERAGRLGAYDQLTQSDLVEYLAVSPRRYDLVLAADVFIYVGALEPVFAAVARAMDAGGVFCFSVEESAQAGGFQLQPSLRYVHSEAYVRSLAAQHGFTVTDTVRHPIREDQRKPIPGLFCWLTKA